MANNEKAPEKVKVAHYKGTADVREIDSASWKNVGADDQKKVVWNKANNWSVPLSDLTAEAVAYLETDEGFEIVES